MEIQFRCRGMQISPGNALDLWLEFKEAKTQRELHDGASFFADVTYGYPNAVNAIGKAGIEIIWGGVQ